MLISANEIKSCEQKEAFCDDGRRIVQMPPCSSFKKYLFCVINNSRKNIMEIQSILFKKTAIINAPYRIRSPFS